MRSLDYRHLLSAIGLSIIAGCASTDILITPIGTSPVYQIPPPIEYSDFDEAMFHLDFGYLLNLELTAEERLYSQALEWMTQGQIDKAAANLSRLTLNQSDNTIQVNARSLLMNVLLMQSKWNDALSIHPPANGPEDIYYTHAKAFSQLPDEILEFPTKATSVPLRFARGGQPLIPVLVNGHKRWFVLDTGAQFSAVSERITGECQIRAVDGRGEEVPNDRFSIPGVIDDLQIGGISLKHHPVMIVKSRDLDIRLFGILTLIEVEGIIGWPFIKNVKIEIDYVNATATISKPITDGSRNRNLFYYYRPFVSMKTSEGVPVHLHLDTGADQTYLTQKILKRVRFGRTSSSRTVRSRSQESRVSKQKKIHDFALLSDEHEFLFGSLRLDPNPAFYDGILGSDVASNGRITIDFHNGSFGFALVKTQ